MEFQVVRHLDPGRNSRLGTGALPSPIDVEEIGHVLKKGRALLSFVCCAPGRGLFVLRSGLCFLQAHHTRSTYLGSGWYRIPLWLAGIYRKRLPFCEEDDGDDYG